MPGLWRSHNNPEYSRFDVTMKEQKISSSICRRCGRKLKDPFSQERGYGPECWGKLMKDVRKPLFKVKKT